MPRYLESGMRRDCCVILYESDELRAQELKQRLQAHYGTRIDAQQFRERLDALVSTGHVEHRVDGIHDVYALTEGGERALLAHVEWLTERVEGRSERTG
jgi:DNA-binding PadR family transcriptional regulator